MAILDAFPGELLDAIVSNPPESGLFLTQDVVFDNNRILSTGSTHPPAGSVFDTFPAELIEAIIFSSSESLKSLCLVGKRFVGHAQWRLFHAAVLRSERQCDNLSAVLSSKPHLAQCVRCLLVSNRTEAGGFSWAASSHKLPTLLLKLRCLKSFSVMNDPESQMKWDDLPPPLKCGIETTMSRPTLTSVTLVCFVFSSPFDLARLLTRAKASLEELALLATHTVALGPPILSPDTTTDSDSLPQIAPTELMIQDDVSSSMMRILLPAPDSLCPFINTSKIHTLNLEFINVWFTVSIDAILNNLPSLRNLRIAPFNHPFTDSTPISFQSHTQLTSLCLDFTQSLDCVADQPHVSAECPIEWATRVLSTFKAENCMQTFKLGIPPDIIAGLKEEDRVVFPQAPHEMGEHLMDCRRRQPALTTLSCRLVGDFPKLSFVELLVGRPGEEATYQCALDIAREYLAVGWRAKARVMGKLDSEGAVTVRASCNMYDAHMSFE